MHSLMLYILVDAYSHLIPLSYMFLQLVIFNKEKSVIDCIAKENACKALGYNAPYTQSLNHLRCLLS